MEDKIKAALIISAAIVTAGLLFLVVLPQKPSGTIIEKSVIQTDEIRDERTAEEACAPLLTDVKKSNPGKSCELAASERIDFGGQKINDPKCVDGASIAGCFACRFSCK